MSAAVEAHHLAPAGPMQPVSKSAGGIVFANGAFEEATDDGGVAAELQAARLRLEAAEGERAALAAELAATQGRLHDALEVLEGVLSERSLLRRQAQELQDQLAAALAEQASVGEAGALLSPGADGPASVRSGGATPPQVHIHREVLLLRAQLAELRAARQGWEAERQQMLLEVEEERQRLQQGLAQALTHASSAQREADSAAERAAHWCSLAQVLQRAALLPEGPSPAASPASVSTDSRYSPLVQSLRTSAAKPSSSGGGGKARACGLRLSALECSPPACAAHPLRQRLSASPGGSAEGSGLISAFHAVAAQSPAAARHPPPEPAQQGGLPAQQRYPSPQHSPCASCKQAEPPAAAGPRSTGLASSIDCAGAAPIGLAASSELAPGTHLRLLHAHRLPTPGMSWGSAASSLNLGCGEASRGGSSDGSAGPNPLTPEPTAALAAFGEAGAAGRYSAEHGGCSDGGSAAAPAPRNAATLTASQGSPVGSTKAAPKQRPRPLFSRLLCAAALPRD